MTRSRSPHVRRLVPALALLCAAAVLPACAATPAAGGAAEAAGSAGSSPASYTLKVTDPGNSGWLAVAKRDGVLEAALEPLDAAVEWVPSKGAVSANLPLFATGAIQVSEGAYTPVVGASAQDAPIKIGAVTASSGPRTDAGIIATRDSGVTAVADLVGKTIAVNPAGKGEYVVLQALAHAGLEADQVTLERLQPSDGLAAFSAGKVDAIATFGEFFRQAQSSGTVVATESDIESKDEEILLFTSDLIEDRPDIAAAVVAAAAPVVAGRSADPTDYVNVFEESGPRALSGPALTWAVDSIAQPVELRQPTAQDREDLQDVIDLFVKNDVIPAGVSADDLIADLG